ncbi:MAG: hypothetical protein L0332_07880 [Chloroflexi bacterium]|nr:hypothetical protein [Chloroflexota bacterium]
MLRRKFRVRPGRARGKKDWVELLLHQIRGASLPEPRQEYVFHAERNWRFDLDWKQQGHLVACEIDGGIWLQTSTGRSKGHAHPVRFQQDLEKFNEAALYGWLIIRVTPEMIRDGRAIDWLKRALDICA